MQKLEKLPEWAGRKAESRAPKEAWSAAERNQPLVTIDLDPDPEYGRGLDPDPEYGLDDGRGAPKQLTVDREPGNLRPKQDTPTKTPVVTIDPEPRRGLRWLVVLAFVSLIAGLGAGLLYLMLG